MMKFNILPIMLLWVVFMILSIVTIILCIYVIKYDSMKDINLIIYTSCVSLSSITLTMFVFILHLCSLKRAFRHTQLEYAELM